MTSKQTVKDFLHFLNTRSGNVVTDYNTYDYKELRKALIDCLSQAMEDGYKQGHLEAEAATLYDVSIGGHKDW